MCMISDLKVCGKSLELKQTSNITVITSVEDQN